VPDDHGISRQPEPEKPPRSRHQNLTASGSVGQLMQRLDRMARKYRGRICGFAQVGIQNTGAAARDEAP
jgi:hypothetical protein